MKAKSNFSILRESSLHAALKATLAQPGDEVEAVVDGFTIDLVRGDLLIEIQTQGFGALKRKLARLLEQHHVRLVHPIAREKWIVRTDARGEPRKRRKSPKRGRVEDVFTELVSLASLATHPNFSLEVLLVQVDEVWADDGRGSWHRRRWSITDRRLLGVVDSATFAAPRDYLRRLPATLPQPFTTHELATELGAPRYLAQKMAYCLRVLGVLKVVGQHGNARLYAIATKIRTARAPRRPVSQD